MTGARPLMRVWRLPLALHLAALTAVLVMLLPLVGAAQVFTVDEGAAAIQARSLAEGGGWVVEHPLPEVDPQGELYPVADAERGSRGFVPLGKHPAYALLAGAAYRAAGFAGIVLLSVAGTVAAAAAAAHLAGGSRARLALWTVGVASPLFFDGYLAMGHTLGAALAGGAVLAARAALGGRRLGGALAVAACLAAATLVRTEAILFGGAMAVAALVQGARHARVRAAAAAVAVAAAGGVLLARLGEQAWVASITGEAVADAGAGLPAEASGFARERIEGLVLTWLTPGYGAIGVRGIALLIMLAAVVAGAGLARARPRGGPGPGLALIGAGAAVAAVVALAVGRAETVPGLLVAFPLLPAGVVVMRRWVWEEPLPGLIAMTCAAFSAGVLLTQYAVGGGAEWGGRYFALMLPALVPLVLAALDRAGRELDRRARRGAVAALVACSLATSVMAVTVLRSSHRARATLAARIVAAGAATADPRPVVVTTWAGAPRAAWTTFYDHRWIRLDPGTLGSIGPRLRSIGVDRFVLVTADPAADAPAIGDLGSAEAVGPPDGRGRQVLVVTPA